MMGYPDYDARHCTHCGIWEARLNDAEGKPAGEWLPMETPFEPSPYALD